MSKTGYYILATIGGLIGGWLGSLFDGGNILGIGGILGSVIGGVLAIIIGYKIAKNSGV